MEAIEFGGKMVATPPDDEYVFDFAPQRWAEPLGALYAANALRCFTSDRKPARLRAVNYDTTTCHSYLSHIGFFRAFGLGYGNEPGVARGSSSYLPITEIEIAELNAEAFDTDRTLADLVQRKADELVNVLTQRKGGDGRTAMVFAFREVMRNAAEHSESGSLWYSAQYWPGTGSATIAMLDTGIGLRQSLAQNPHLQVKDDRDAIRFALLPGVSGKAFKGSRVNGYDNAGFGLYMTSALGHTGGRFVIASGTQGLNWNKNAKRYFAANIEGTALDITTNMSAIASIDAELDFLKKRGERIEIICRRIFDAGGSLSGESASKMLTP